MLDTNRRGEAGQTPVPPPLPDFPKFLSRETAQPAPSLRDALARIVGPVERAGRADGKPSQADIERLCEDEPVAPYPPGGPPSADQPALDQPAAANAAGLASPAMTAWMSRARRRRRSAVLRQFAAWTVTILVAGGIVATAALAVAKLGAPPPPSDAVVPSFNEAVLVR